MKAKSSISLLIVVIDLIIFTSCEYQTIQPQTQTVVINPTDTAKFSKDVGPVLNKNCTNCHNSPSSTEPDYRYPGSCYTSLTSNNLVSKPSASSQLMLHLNDPTHGGGATNNVTATQKARIAMWIDAGALNN